MSVSGAESDWTSIAKVQFRFDSKSRLINTPESALVVFTSGRRLLESDPFGFFAASAFATDGDSLSPSNYFDRSKYQAMSRFLRKQSKIPRCKSRNEMNVYYATALPNLRRKAHRIVTNLSCQRRVNSADVKWVLDTCFEFEWGNGLLVEDNHYFDMWMMVQGTGTKILEDVLLVFEAFLNARVTNDANPDSPYEPIVVISVYVIPAKSNQREKRDESLPVRPPILQFPQVQTTCAPNAA